MTPESAKIRGCVDGLVGLVIHAFAVADAYSPASDALRAGGDDVRGRDAMRRRLLERIRQSQERFQRGFEALVEALLESTRREHDPHYDELLTRLQG